MAGAQYCIFIMWGYLLIYAPLVIASFVILVLLWNTSFAVIKRRFFRFAGTFTGKYEQSGSRSGFSFAAGIMNLYPSYLKLHLCWLHPCTPVT